MNQKTSRPTLDQVYLRMAKLVATRSTCRHRDQGAILVKGNHVISTGYNGAPPSQPHCIDFEHCVKEHDLLCRAEGLHGESNALLTAARLGIATEGSVLYSVYSPCAACCNMLKVAGVVGVVFIEIYPGFSNGPGYLKELFIWTRQNKLD